MANKPEETFSLAGVQASIFLNSGDQGDFRSIRLQRRYKDAKGEWKSSDSFTASQAANAIAVLHQAIGYTMQQDAAGRNEAQAENQPANEAAVY